jgi:cell division protein FtsQ
LKKNIIAIQIMPDGSLIMLNRDFDYKLILAAWIIRIENLKITRHFSKAVLDSSLYKYKKN